MPPTIKQQEVIGQIVTIRPVGIDEYSHVRYVHTQAVQLLGTAYHCDEEIDARLDLIGQPGYARALFGDNIHAAWIGREMVGTAGWRACDDDRRVARIKALHVQPLFAYLGIGTLLLRNAEERATKAGFRIFSADANINAAAFFAGRGYELQSFVCVPTPCGVDIPVNIMSKAEERTEPGISREHRRPAATPVLNEAPFMRYPWALA